MSHTDKSVKTGRQLVDFFNDASCRSRGCCLQACSNKLNDRHNACEPCVTTRYKNAMQQRKADLNRGKQPLGNLTVAINARLEQLLDSTGKCFLVMPSTSMQMTLTHVSR